MTTETRLVDQLAGALAASPGLTARQLIAAVGRTGLGVSKSEINSTLYREHERFWNDGATPPRWHLVANPVKWSIGQLDPPAPVAPKTPDPNESSAIQLYEWQAEALHSWKRQARRGVVEAVTGTGKTMVGIAAALESLDAGGNVQIVVPTIELLRQWTAQLQRWIPKNQIGQLGDGNFALWKSKRVIVSVVNSARMYDLGTPGRSALLIADECHRYGSASNARALDDRFDRRLGLSATYGRSDDGNAAFLDPYFGDTCFRMDYRRAIADEVTAHFKVALVGVPFAPGERDAYELANRNAYEAQRWLIENGYVTEEPFGEFMKDVSTLSQGDHGRATWKARAFLSAFTERRRILAESPAKREHLLRLLPALSGADRSIVFTQTVEAAEDAVHVIRAGGLTAEAIHSKLVADERRRVLARFASGGLQVISAPQVLDEGVDVPAADLAVILAASKTRRQMIQRMGRVLRRKDDGRLARFVVMYLEGSSEDPANGAHGDFLSEVTEVADQVANFASGTAARDICAFLNDFTPSAPQPPPRMATAGSPVAPSTSPAPAPQQAKRPTAPERPMSSPPQAPVKTTAKASSPVATKAKKPKAVKKPKQTKSSGRQVSKESPAGTSKASGRPAAGTGMTIKRLLRIYKATGLEKSKHRSEIGPVLYKLGHLSDEALIHALRQTTRPHEIEGQALAYRPPPSDAVGAETPVVSSPPQPSAQVKTNTKAKADRGPSAARRYCPSCERLEEACVCG